jgi:hypothetical protein
MLQKRLAKNTDPINRKGKMRERRLKQRDLDASISRKPSAVKLMTDEIYPQKGSKTVRMNM